MNLLKGYLNTDPKRHHHPVLNLFCLQHLEQLVARQHIVEILKFNVLAWIA